MFKASGQAQFDKLLEKATSNLLLEPDWGSIMMICDLIRQKDCQPKYAVAAIRKKLHHQNPHVSMFGLQVLESIVKNCGSPVHDEVATKGFMEELRELAKTSHHDPVKEKVLELILTWAHAFRRIPTYRAVQDVVNIMKAEGAAFKPLIESDAMFVADTAPEWADGECCNRCRTEFGLVNRKHHCRACGQIFCHKCSSKQCSLPKFGIEKEVRVCDSCFDKYGKDGSSASDPEELVLRGSSGSGSGAVAQVRSTPGSQQPSSQSPPGKTEEELAEEEQLQLALAISQSEAEAKEVESKKRSGGGGLTMASYSYPSEIIASPTHAEKDKGSPQKSSSAGGADTDDPELARYLNRGYWENRSKDEGSIREETSTSSGSKSTSEKVNSGGGGGKSSWNSSYSFLPSAPIKENKDKIEPVEEIDSFVENLRSQIEMFVNRMKSNSSRGRPIAYDTSVQGLFMNITAMHSQLLNFIQAQDNGRGYYEGLQDKLGQIRDARAALDDLRFEHREKLRQEAEEQERIRQFQMAQKLQFMRQKKQEYLQYQRQLAMQRMQDQEREMLMRIEQQSRQMGMGAMQNPYGGGFQPGMMPPGYVPGPGNEMMYMPQSVPGQFIPPNVSLTQQGQVPMGQFMPQQQQQQPPPQQGGPYNMPQMVAHVPPSQPQPQQQQQGQMPMVASGGPPGSMPLPHPSSSQQQMMPPQSFPTPTGPPPQQQQQNQQPMSPPPQSSGQPPEMQQQQQQQQSHPHTPVTSPQTSQTMMHPQPQMTSGPVSQSNSQVSFHQQQQQPDPVVVTPQMFPQVPTDPPPQLPQPQTTGGSQHAMATAELIHFE